MNVAVGSVWQLEAAGSQTSLKEEESQMFYVLGYFLAKNKDSFIFLLLAKRTAYLFATQFSKDNTEIQQLAVMINKA